MLPEIGAPVAPTASTVSVSALGYELLDPLSQGGPRACCSESFGYGRFTADSAVKAHWTWDTVVPVTGKSFSRVTFKYC